MHRIKPSQRFPKLFAFLVLGVAVFCFTSVPRARADKDDDCKHRIEHADHNLHEAIEHHGPSSSEADHARRELHEAREHCWNENHKWWDEDQHRWHDQQDWNDHDHDHDFDHNH